MTQILIRKNYIFSAFNWFDVSLTGGTTRANAIFILVFKKLSIAQTFVDRRAHYFAINIVVLREWSVISCDILGSCDCVPKKLQATCDDSSILGFAVAHFHRSRKFIFGLIFFATFLKYSFLTVSLCAFFQVSDNIFLYHLYFEFKNDMIIDRRKIYISNLFDFMSRSGLALLEQIAIYLLVLLKFLNARTLRKNSWIRSFSQLILQNMLYIIVAHASFLVSPRNLQIYIYLNLSSRFVITYFFRS